MPPLVIAVRKGNDDMIKWLLANGANPGLAVELHGNMKLAEQLQKGLLTPENLAQKITEFDANPEFAKQLTAHNGPQLAAAILAAPHEYTMHASALYFTAQNSLFSLAKIIIEDAKNKGRNIHHIISHPREHDDWTPLFGTAFHKQNDNDLLAELFIENGADLVFLDSCEEAVNKTALDYAVRGKRWQVVLEIIFAGPIQNLTSGNPLVLLSWRY